MKKSKKPAQISQLSELDDILPHDLSLLYPLLSHTPTTSTCLEHTFSFKGTFHISAYLPITPTTTVQELITLLQRDVSLQFQTRLEVFDEEATNNPAMVNPFDLNTHNMTRIEGFNLLMPRRVWFEASDKGFGFKEKLVFNDYLLFFETEEECQRRMQDATGLTPWLPMKSFERVDKEEVERKLLRNIGKS